MGIESIIGTRASLVLLNVLLALAALGFLWGVVKLSYQQVTGEAMPRTKLTLALDVFVEVVNNVLGAVNKAKVARGGAPLFMPLEPEPLTPPSPSKVPAAIPPRDNGQRGRTSISGLTAVIAAAGLALALSLAVVPTGCRPQPVPTDGGVAVTPSGWSSIARVVLDVLRWAVPAARVILDATLPEPARTIVGRALDYVTDAGGRLRVAVDAYESRGGDSCAGYAAAGAVQVALLELSDALADNGIALGTTLGRVVDLVGSITDNLIPACQGDAGWASAGESANAHLRSLDQRARARGVVLSRILDDLRPVDAR